MRRVLLILAFLLAALPLAAAMRPAAEQERIDWLLSQVRGSDAVFVRNGKEYDGQQAAAHLKSKLWWAGKRVQTAREFIVGVASHSEASGQPYQIKQKDGARELLEKWLLQRLAVFEEGLRERKPVPGP